MRHALLTLILFGFILLSCNSINTGASLLTENNSDSLELSYQYWYSKELSETPSKPFWVRITDSLESKKLWVIEPYPNEKNEKPAYLRAKKLNDNKYLFQLASFDDEKLISLFYGRRLNDSVFSFYGYKDGAFDDAIYSTLLQPLGSHVRLKKDEIYFDSIAVVNNSERILQFLKTEMNDDSKFEKDSLVLMGSNTLKAINNLN